MSVSLNAFLQAEDQKGSSDFLALLIDESVEPAIKAYIRGKLHVSLHTSDERQINQDGIDLVSEVKTLIIAKLTKLKSGNGHAPIDNLETYVKATARNATTQYLREKYPLRLRLKNQLRYLLTHDRRFSLWTSESNDWRCGLREWLEAEAELSKIDRSPLALERLVRELTGRDIFPERMALVDLVAAIFSYIQGPLHFGDLVSIIYELKRITEPAEVSETEAFIETSTGNENDVLDRLEQAAFLKTLWVEIGQLPLRHRAALLLNLKNSHGEGLITLLPLTRVATIREIAANLEFPLEEFARVWNELPWDDLRIADHLKLTRQQVINLRQSARSTLRRRLNYF